MYKIVRRPEPPALRSGHGVLDAKRLGVNVRLEREIWSGDVVVLASDVDLSLGCPMSPLAPVVRRR